MSSPPAGSTSSCSATSARSSSRSAAGCAATPRAAASCSTATRAGRAVQLGPRPAADPVAEPDPPRPLRVARPPPPARAHRAGAPERDPRPRALGALDGRRARSRTGSRSSTCSIRSPATRSRSRCGVEYALSDGGLSVRTSATNVGAEPCPYGAGAHPYLTVGTETVDSAVLRAPAGTVLTADEDDIPVGSAPVDGTELDFRRRTADRRDAARPRLHRARARRRRARARRARASRTARRA